MNTFKRKALASAVLGTLAAIGTEVQRAVYVGGKTAAWFLLSPVYSYYNNPRNGLVKFDNESDEIKALEKTLTSKLKEFSDEFSKNRTAMDQGLKDLASLNAIEGKTADALKQHGEAVTKLQGEVKSISEGLAARILEAEQKIAKKAADLDAMGANFKSAGQLFAGSEELKDFVKLKGKNSTPFEIKPGALFGKGAEMAQKTAIFNATLNTLQPLVPPLYRPGIIIPANNRRLTIRDLLPQITTESNVIEFAQELVFTNNAGPQGGLTSPTATNGEGEIKPESGITFTLANAIVITLAHFIPASRQILADAPALAGYIDSRLGYGLKLEEENELLNGTGVNGTLTGLRSSATGFTGGVTNQQTIDTLLKAFTQVALSNFEATGAVLHPTDWMNLLLLKDTLGRYLYADPHSANTASIWGKSVVPTMSMAIGNFLVGAFDLGAAIYDREGMNIRIAEQHADFFVRNMVAILCEERLALAIYRPLSLVAGVVSYAG